MVGGIGGCERRTGNMARWASDRCPVTGCALIHCVDMLMARSHRRFTAWLAMLAMVLSALAPTLALAVLASSDDTAQWVEVCSASGMVWVKADTAEDVADQQSSEHSAPVSAAVQQCAWCSLHGGAAGLPPSVGPADPPPRYTLRFSAFARFAALAGVWVVAHARAPPLAA